MVDPNDAIIDSRPFKPEITIGDFDGTIYFFSEAPQSYDTSNWDVTGTYKINIVTPDNTTYTTTFEHTSNP